MSSSGGNISILWSVRGISASWHSRLALQQMVGEHPGACHRWIIVMGDVKQASTGF